LLQIFDSFSIKEYSKIQTEDRKEIAFYAVQIASSERASRKSHFIIIQLRLIPEYKFFPEVLKYFGRASQFCFPVSCKGVHIICAPKLNDSIQRRFANKVLPFIWKVMEIFASHAERRTLDFITWSDENELHERLATLLIGKFGVDHTIAFT
jgi:hypothetical protein